MAKKTYKIEALLNSGFDFSVVFPEKQKALQEHNGWNFGLQELAILIKTQTKNFKEVDDVCLDMDNYLYEAYEKWVAKENPSTPESEPTDEDEFERVEHEKEAAEYAQKEKEEKKKKREETLLQYSDSVEFILDSIKELSKDKSKAAKETIQQYKDTVDFIKDAIKELKAEKYAEGGSVSGYNVGDLVFCANEGQAGLVGLIVSDAKTDDYSTVGYNVYFRGWNGDSFFVPNNEMVDVLNGYSDKLLRNGDLSAYQSIAKKEGVTLNPKYAEYVNDEESYLDVDAEFKKGGEVSGKKYAVYTVTKDGEKLYRVFRSSDKDFNIAEQEKAGRVVRELTDKDGSSHHPNGKPEKYTHTKDGVKVEKGTDKYKGHIFYEEDGTAFECLGYFPKLDDCIYREVETGRDVVGCMDGFYFNKPTAAKKAKGGTISDSMLNYAQNHLASGYIGSRLDDLGYKGGLEYRTIDKIRSKVIDILLEHGDEEYSIPALNKLISDAALIELGKAPSAESAHVGSIHRHAKGGTVAPKKPALWMRNAIKHKGALRRKAKELGYIKGDETLTLEMIADMSKQLKGTWTKKLLLAKRLMEMHKN